VVDVAPGLALVAAAAGLAPGEWKNEKRFLKSTMPYGRRQWNKARGCMPMIDSCASSNSWSGRFNDLHVQLLG
jgi:hypothetical protein